MPDLVDIKNIANIVFFVTISVVTILSFIQARKTLFQPITTEVFRLQLDELRDVLRFFRNKGTIEFVDEMDLDRMVQLNAMRMVSEYVATFFANELVIDEAIFEPFVELRVLGADLHPVDGFFVNESADDEGAAPDRQPLWSEYHFVAVGCTQAYVDHLRALSGFASSPILPKSIRDEITQFEAIVDGYTSLIREAMEGAAKEMEALYPTEEELLRFSPDWIISKFAERRGDLDDHSTSVVASVNAYLQKISYLQDL